MKNKNIYLFIIVLLLVSSIIYYFTYFKSQTSKCQNKENFTSGFRRMYRPYIRNARVYYHNNLHFMRNKGSVLLKKWGIL